MTDTLTWWIRDAANSICGQTGAKAHQKKLHEAADKMEATRKAADAILAPLTAEYGRLMEENPDYEIVVSFGEYAVSMPASRFMALYHATDDEA